MKKKLLLGLVLIGSLSHYASAGELSKKEKVAYCKHAYTDFMNDYNNAQDASRRGVYTGSNLAVIFMFLEKQESRINGTCDSYLGTKKWNKLKTSLENGER